MYNDSIVSESPRASLTLIRILFGGSVAKAAQASSRITPVRTVNTAFDGDTNLQPVTRVMPRTGKILRRWGHDVVAVERGSASLGIYDRSPSTLEELHRQSSLANVWHCGRIDI